MSSRPCLGCGKLIDSGSRGSACKPRRFNKAKRGSGGKAATFRRRTLALTNGACAVCGSRDRVEAHHLGPTDADGGVALCLRHHRQITAAESRAPSAVNSGTMKNLILVLGVACLATLGGLLILPAPEEQPAEPPLISTQMVRANISSKADWYASFPKTTVAGIAMGCDLPVPVARSHNRRLGQTFSRETLASFRADCKG